MEKLILKWVTGCSGFVTVVACICLFLFPGIKESMLTEPTIQLVPEKVEQVDILPEKRPEVSAGVKDTQLEESEEKDSQVADEDKNHPETKKDELNIELPEGVDGSGVTISNDYLTQTVSVRFQKGVDDYSSLYRVYGSSNYISSLSYYKDGSAGVLEIQLDQLCEFTYRYHDGFLALSFIDPHDIYDKVVVVDAGHGGRAPGAVKKDICEKDLNLAIVKEIKALFDEIDDNGIKVYYTRTTDKNPSLAKRVGLANAAKADLFISIHNNSSASGKFNEKNGTMVLYNQDDTSEFSSKRFAEICLTNVMASAGSNRRGLAKGNYVHIVRNSQVPVALIEVGYMTNLKELEKLQTKEYQQLVAQGVYNAVMQAFEEGY